MNSSSQIPILLHMVTSSSPTVLESSTRMVLIAPSSILIFCGRCFFLYSKISWGKKKRENLVSGWAAGRDPRTYAVKCFSHSISQHVVIQSSSGFEPDSFPGIIVGEEESVIWRWGRNMTCRWRSGLSSDVTVARLSPNLVLSGLRGPSPWWSCRRRTPGWTARTASSSPRCTGAHRSLVTKPPSWWVA